MIVNSAVLTDTEINEHLGYYPEYMPASVLRALAEIKRKSLLLDAITVCHYVVESDFGGLGIGEPKEPA